MQRSGSQTALLVFSIIEIIGAVLVLLAAFAAIAATGLIGVAGTTGDLTAEETAIGAAMGGILSIVLVIGGVWSLLCGIFGIRAANDNQKIMIVWVFVIIGLVLNAVGLVMSIINGTFTNDVFSAIVPLAINVIMFVICNNIKREAGK